MLLLFSHHFLEESKNRIKESNQLIKAVIKGIELLRNLKFKKLEYNLV